MAGTYGGRYSCDSLSTILHQILCLVGGPQPSFPCSLLGFRDSIPHLVASPIDAEIFPVRRSVFFQPGLKIHSLLPLGCRSPYFSGGVLRRPLLPSHGGVFLHLRFPERFFGDR